MKRVLRLLLSLSFAMCLVLCMAACDVGDNDDSQKEHEHSFGSWIDEVSASCEADGALGHYHCSDCGKDFDADKKELSSLVIPASHRYGSWIDEMSASCEADGALGHYHCSDCGKDFDADKNELSSLVIPASHSYGAWTVTREATCSLEGIKVQVCDCGEKNTSQISMLPHTEETVKGKAATCTETGLTDGKRCTVCNKTTLEQLVLGIVPHTEETVKGKAATCTETGLTDGKRCTVCNKITLEQVVLGIVPHTEETVKGKAATCTETGLTDGKICSVCKLTILAQQVIPSEHVYVDGVCKFCQRPRGSYGLEYELSRDRSYYTVIGIGVCVDSDIVIPSFHEDIPVLHIKTNAFKDNTNITSLTVSDGVKTIGEGAFRNCTSLRSLDLGNTVETIGKNAFRECTSLISVVIPDSVTKLTEYAFNRCYRLSNVVIGSGVTKIEDFTFYFCHSLSRVVIGENVQSFGYDPFYYCFSVTEVYNLSGVILNQGLKGALDVYDSLDTPSKLFETEDGYLMYDGGDTCYLIKYNGFESELVLPADCHGKSYEIYKYAFYKYFDDVTSVRLSEKVTAIGECAFWGMDSLESVEMPVGELRVLCGDAFYDCDLLREIVVPYGVTEIKNAFSDCSMLESLILPDTLTYAVEVVGIGMDSLEYNIYKGAKYIGSISNPYMLLCGVEDKGIASVEIHSDTKFIGYNAFLNCASLVSVNIPDGALMIDGYAFRGCTALTSVYIPDTVIYIAYRPFWETSNVTAYIALSEEPAEGWSDTWKEFRDYGYINVVWA